MTLAYDVGFMKRVSFYDLGFMAFVFCYDLGFHDDGFHFVEDIDIESCMTT